MLNLIRQTGLRFLWLSLVVFGLDQWTKHAVLDAMQLYQSIEIMPLFNLTYVHNYGAAFSFLHDADGWQRWFFTGIAAVVSVLILWWLRNTSKQQVMLPVAFCLILGGALGNVYDRLVHGYVIDFLDFYVGAYHWPAFNLADAGIFIGALMLIIDMFINSDQNESGASQGSSKSSK